MQRLILAVGATLVAAALLAGPASAHVPRPAGAVFVQTDDPGGNTVVAYDRNPDGSLRQAGSYRTGGRGGVLGGSVVDHLASQGSLTYDRANRLLYAVNAGSDTITVFGVDGDRLIRHQVLPSFGDFPVSVTAHGRLVYVLNARGGGSIQGYARVGGFLVPVGQWHRRLGLDPAATPEFTTTPGEVAFSPDGDQLIVTTKGNGSAVDVFGIDRLGGPSARPGTTVLPGAVPFAVAFDARGNLAVSEAGPNAVATFALDFLYVQTGAAGGVDAFRVGADGKLTPVGSVTVPDAVGGEGIAAS